MTSEASPTPEKITLADAFERIPEPWQPRIAGRVNDVHVKLAKLDGEFIWHQHPDEDELFLVIEGTLEMHFRDRRVTLEAGDLLIVPRGVEHLPVAPRGPAHVLLVEPVGTRNTGDLDHERTIEARPL